MEYLSLKRNYKKWGIITLISIYLLVLLGGIVRSTGSGMGCPDWPKCFGQWVPPTDAAQLPVNYKEVYAEKRKVKNNKLAKMLLKLNLISLSSAISADDSVYKEQDFNAIKTWIEYLNRVFGVLVGIAVVILAFISIQFRKLDFVITVNSIISLVLVCLEGWIGSIVVSTNLLPFTVTVHMFLAIILIGLLIYTIVRSQGVLLKLKECPRIFNYFIVCLILITSLQILLGSRVRESIDHIAAAFNYQNRNLWIENLGSIFYIHRSISSLILVFNLLFLYRVNKQFGLNSPLYRIALWFNILLWAEVAVGIGMAYFSIPAFLQPFHLLLGCLILGLQFTFYAFVINLHINNKTVIGNHVV